MLIDRVLSRITLLNRASFKAFGYGHYQLLCRKTVMPMDWNKLAGVRPLIGVVQMNSTSSKDDNFQQAKALIERAQKQGAQVVFLPECFDFVGESSKQTYQMAESIDGPLISRYKELAQKLGVWLSLGGFHEKNEESEKVGKVFNTHIVINQDGEVCAKYSKTHLFHVDIPDGARLMEAKFVVPGTTIGPPVSTPVGKVGLAICYDLRFPEMSIALAQQGANILTYPSAFTVPTGMAHWEVLLRSRAIENQCYVIAAAQVGKHNEKRSSYGHTMIVDPWGCVVSECQDGIGVCVAEIDEEYHNKRRQQMPVWEHRRHDIYGHIEIHPKGSIDECPAYKFGKVTIKPSQVFYKTALSFAFVNIKPVLPGHMLIAPLRVAKRFADLSQAEISDLFAVAHKVSGVVQDVFECGSMTLAIQDGPEAGQTVEHVHVHILPRKAGDFKVNDNIYDTLENHDKDATRGSLRSEEEMEAEAMKLRPNFV